MKLAYAIFAYTLIHARRATARPEGKDTAESSSSKMTPLRANLRKRKAREATPAASGNANSNPNANPNSNLNSKGQLIAKGKFGKINISDNASAQAGAKSVLEDHFGSKRGFSYKNSFKSQNSKSQHIRFGQQIHGYDVEGASLFIHTDEDGNVISMNGELVSKDGVPSKPTIDAGPAMKTALAQSVVPAQEHSNCGPIEQTVVRGLDDGQAHLAWTCTVRYDVLGKDGYLKPFNDQVYAAATGEPRLLHIAPKIYGAGISMETRNCNQSTTNCPIVSSSTNTISTGDEAVDSAHNFAIATYDYYMEKFGRDSIDDNGMPLISRVHYSTNYNNAFWDGSQMTYGDGDGQTFVPLSQDADVVAHELTHGVTERSSGLIYQNESGALNEAMSDIFGALVEQYLCPTADPDCGADNWKIWILGEDIYTPGTPGDGLRNMCDPAAEGDYDYYPTRYTGTGDNGGVHSNSGIANLAACLMVRGGTHPRGTTSISVPHVGGGLAESQEAFDEMGRIFYEANVACLTSSSDFAMARWCTTVVHGEGSADYVNLAWDAVGVPSDYTPIPPMEFDMVNNEGTYGGQSLNTGDVQQYHLTVGAGSKVTCSTVGSNGDADLYVRFNYEAIASPNSVANECASFSSNSNESCTTGPAVSEGTDVYAGVHAWSEFSGLTVTCAEIPDPSATTTTSTTTTTTAPPPTTTTVPPLTTTTTSTTTTTTTVPPPTTTTAPPPTTTTTNMTPVSCGNITSKNACKDQAGCHWRRNRECVNQNRA